MKTLAGTMASAGNRALARLKHYPHHSKFKAPNQEQSGRESVGVVGNSWMGKASQLE